jgi:hypothetical protein
VTFHDVIRSVGSHYSANLIEVDVAGRACDLEELAGILAVGSGSPATFSGADPSPYQGFLPGIVVRSVPESRVVLSVDGGEGVLNIVGSSDFLCILAENLLDLCREGVRGEHLHIEYFPEHFYLAESRVSLVVHLSNE